MKGLRYTSRDQRL